MGKYNLYLAAYDDTRAPHHGLRVHWALLLAPPPKHEDPTSFAKSNTRYHVTNKNGHWEFERRHIECVRTPAMLGRVLVGTVAQRDFREVDRLLEEPHRMRVGDPRWDCRGWVEEALVDLAKGRILQVGRRVQLDNLFAFAQRFAEEVAMKGLNVGYGVPVTVEYPGHGSSPKKIITSSKRTLDHEHKSVVR
ncbi:hypothetical protein C8Q80DRAFT_1115960 [Daedaleopsis nitida]|nr:hypothetical protein C8Q80DRAFT_1115960 [Daedaleopsis nitida]